MRAMGGWGLALLLVAGCGSPSSPQPARPRTGAATAPCRAAGEAMIRGQVRDAKTGEVLAGATVAVVRPGWGSRTAVSDEAGRYEIRGLVPGTYAVAAYHGDAELRGAEVRVEVGSTLVPLAIERPAPGPRSHPHPSAVIVIDRHACWSPNSCPPRSTDMLHGSVEEAGGWRVTNALVVAVDPQDPAFRFEARTDKQGEFFLGLLPPGVYDVTASSEGRVGRRQGVRIEDGLRTQITLQLPPACVAGGSPR